MAELEDEDLTAFTLDDLIDLANEITKRMKEENGATKNAVEKLQKVAVELLKKI